MPFLATVLITLLLAVPAMSVALFGIEALPRMPVRLNTFSTAMKCPGQSIEG
jgi:hypothetical protein